MRFLARFLCYFFVSTCAGQQAPKPTLVESARSAQVAASEIVNTRVQHFSSLNYEKNEEQTAAEYLTRGLANIKTGIMELSEGIEKANLVNKKWTVEAISKFKQGTEYLEEGLIELMNSFEKKFPDEYNLTQNTKKLMDEIQEINEKIRQLGENTTTSPEPEEMLEEASETHLITEDTFKEFDESKEELKILEQNATSSLADVIENPTRGMESDEDELRADREILPAKTENKNIPSTEQKYNENNNETDKFETITAETNIETITLKTPDTDSASKRMISQTNTPQLNRKNETIVKTTKKPVTVVYSKAERQALDKFRPLVIHLIKRDEDKTDAFLMSWLQARNLDVQKAYQMFAEYLKWRKEERIDGILDEGLILEFTPKPYMAEGFDRKGHPLLLIYPTSVDLRKLAIQNNLHKFYRYGMQFVETALANGRKSPILSENELIQITVVIDFHGFNLRQHACLACLPMFRDLLIAFESYYPGRVGHLIGINFPRIGLPILESLKPLLSQTTLKNFKAFGTNRLEWTPYLLSIIAPDQLPYRFGGTRKT